MRCSYKWICPTPKSECVGMPIQVGKHSYHGHGSPGECLSCYKRYLISQGYKQVGQREFQKDDGPILFLTKKSKFGSPVRTGKNEGGSGKRMMFNKTNKNTGGMIISI